MSFILSLNAGSDVFVCLIYNIKFKLSKEASFLRLALRDDSCFNYKLRGKDGSPVKGSPTITIYVAKKINQSVVHKNQKPELLPCNC